ncbi:UNVERIFIED_CONTAM: hypothetical protein Scaly_2291400 [Sesamum calycinum]|uniref:Vesicle transport protein n=1 Tax=Sesamum calycinum TaxID=2727403 RepID=A0AAW2MBW1_9LAMI
MQKWFSAGADDGENSSLRTSSSSLLSDWNSYAAARSSEESSSGGSLAGIFDIRIGCQIAVICEFNESSPRGDFWMREIMVSKGVKDLPGNFQSATSNIPSGKALVYFGLLLASGVFFVFIAFTLFLPVIVLVPQKFAICFTVGCAFTHWDPLCPSEVLALAYYAISYFPGGSNWSEYFLHL